MSGPGTTFRLLDARVGWDPRPDDGLVGLTLDGGVLQLLPRDEAASAHGSAVLGRSRDGTWWLAGRSGLRRLDPCGVEFRAWAENRRIADLAVRGHRVALVLESGWVEVFEHVTGQLLAKVRVADAARVELASDASITVTDRSGGRTWLDPSGLVCSADPPCRPGDPLPPRPPSRPWPSDVASGEYGFRLPGRGAFDWNGRRLPTEDVGPAGDDAERRGQFLSVALDSQIPGCRWHRIRVDADTPDATAVEIAFATTDGPAEGRVPAPPGADTWAEFPSGDPNPADWVRLVDGALDSTLAAPPGRYGYLRIRLTGHDDVTPAVHQIRLDLPRSTSLERLPAAYAEDPDAKDFTERLLSIADAQLEEIDEVLARRPSLLDADALPDDALGWLAGLLGTGFETEMPVANRRAFLRAAPELFRRRGTPQGLVETLDVALGVPSTVEELGPARAWGAVGRTHVGALRLFGRSRARVRLGTSRLGIARVDGRGNPDHDALLAGAHRIRVHVPAGTDSSLVARVVRSQIPAHVVADVASATAGFVATTLRLGIDTTLSPPASAVVGDTALGRRGVVSGGRVEGVTFLVGRTATAGPAETEGKEMECSC
jgi:phage tail-like protein